MFLKAALSAGSLVAIPVSMATIPKVFAAESEEKSSAETVTESQKATLDPVQDQLRKLKDSTRSRQVQINQLPLYGEPPQTDILYVPEKEESLRQYVTVLRQSVWYQLDKFEGAWTIVKNNYSTGKKYTQDLVQYLQEDAGALPRATFITVSGLGGMILGYRGGVFRRTFYAAGGMTAASAVCYPPQAIDITKRSWLYTREQATALWKQATAGDNTEKAVESTKEKTESALSSEDKPSSKDTVAVPAKTDQEPSAQPKKDFGMSKEEDKDMYSTRAS